MEFLLQQGSAHSRQESLYHVSICAIMFRSLVFLLAVPFADGYARSGPSCEEFLVDGGTMDVCAIHTEIGPSPAEMNGTIVEVGDYMDTYEIMELPDDGSVTPDDILSMSVNYSDYLTGTTIEVTRFSSGGCEVKLNGDACANCEICEGNSTAVSVDCSVVSNGSLVECEPLENVFLPLEGYTYANPSDGEVSENPPSTSGGDDTSNSPPSNEPSGGSASPQSPIARIVIGCVAAVATMILHM